MKKLLFLSILFVVMASCAPVQGPLMERNAQKRYKQQQRDLNYQFNHRTGP